MLLYVDQALASHDGEQAHNKSKGSPAPGLRWWQPSMLGWKEMVPIYDQGIVLPFVDGEGRTDNGATCSVILSFQPPSPSVKRLLQVTRQSFFDWGSQTHTETTEITLKNSLQIYIANQIHNTIYRPQNIKSKQKPHIPKYIWLENLLFSLNSPVRE